MNSVVSHIVDDLRIRGGLNDSDLANIAEVSQATVSEWAAGKASPHPKPQLVIPHLRRVVDRLAEFYPPEETRTWLYPKHPLMDGARAADLIHGGGTDRVFAVIETAPTERMPNYPFT